MIRTVEDMIRTVEDMIRTVEDMIRTVVFHHRIMDSPVRCHIFYCTVSRVPSSRNSRAHFVSLLRQAKYCPKTV